MVVYLPCKKDTSHLFTFIFKLNMSLKWLFLNSHFLSSVKKSMVYLKFNTHRHRLISLFLIFHGTLKYYV
ncbi:hypothetical protein CPI31_03970 [Moraxella catarrhalis]|nr:hypothetical protein [Moraxella catarrhalis]